MAFATDYISSDRPAGTAKNLLNAVVSAYQNRRAFIKTRNELQSLTNAELADLGIHFGDINRLAYEAAYKN